MFECNLWDTGRLKQGSEMGRDKERECNKSDLGSLLTDNGFTAVMEFARKVLSEKDELTRAENGGVGTYAS